MFQFLLKLSLFSGKLTTIHFIFWTKKKLKISVCQSIFALSKKLFKWYFCFHQIVSHATELLSLLTTVFRIDFEIFHSFAYLDGNLGPNHFSFQFKQMKGKIQFVRVPYATLPRTVPCIHCCCIYQWFVLCIFRCYSFIECHNLI